MMFRNTFVCVLFALLLLPGRIFAYDDGTTHPGLTHEIVDYYNRTHPVPLTEEERSWLIEGSIKEDVSPRWINHFFDPIHGVGWSGLNEGSVSAGIIQFVSLFGLSSEGPLSAIDWVNNGYTQGLYARYEGDQTWNTSLNKYIEGDKKGAFVGLGHVLHVLEDMAVPDHTRNDTHAKIIGIDAGSPYERYATRFDVPGIAKLNLPGRLVAQHSTEYTESSLEDGMRTLSEYSNKHFFSGDTIASPDFVEPSIIEVRGDYAYGRDQSGALFKLAKKRPLVNEELEISKRYILDESEADIFDGYFERLAAQAILHGSGILDLYFKSKEAAQIAHDFPQHLYVADNSVIGLYNVSLYGEISKLAGAFSNQGNTNSEISDSSNSSKSQTSNTSKTAHVSDELGQVTTEDEPESLEVEVPDIETVGLNQDVPLVAKSTSSIPITTSSVPQSPLRSALGGTKTYRCISGDTHITEIMYDLPGADSEGEWLEIMNGGYSSILMNDMRVYSGGSNHYVRTVRGADSLEMSTFGIIALNGDRFIADHPSYAGPVYEASFALTNSANNVELRCGDATIDSVSYRNESGGAGDGNSLQRDGERWVADSPTPGRGTVHRSSVNAVLRIESVEHVVNDQIVFSAASSTCVDCSIVEYGWDFGDGHIATSSTPTIEHTYAAEGNFVISLSIISDAGEIDGATSQISITAVPENIVHIVISEFQVSGAGSDDEFIELYNPNDQSVSLQGHSLQYLSGRATSTTHMYKKNFEDDAAISSHGYFLIVQGSATTSLRSAADMTYSAFSLSGSSSGGTIIIASTTRLISDLNDPSVIDAVSYGDPTLHAQSVTTLPRESGSMERKARADSTADSMLHQDAYRGNGTDSDSGDDFIERTVSLPQNSRMYPEPRDPPHVPVAIEGSDGSVAHFVRSDEIIQFEWAPSMDFLQSTSSVSYEITISDPSEYAATYFTTSTRISVPVTTRDVTVAYSLRATDREGLYSLSTESEIRIPRNNVAPHAIFVTSGDIRAGGSILFDASQTNDEDGTVTLYDWNFGDGYSTSTTTSTLHHVFSRSGQYPVILTAYDDVNAYESASSTISVSPQILYSQTDISGGDVLMPWQSTKTVQYLGSGLQGSVRSLDIYYSKCCGYYYEQHASLYESDELSGSPRTVVFTGDSSISSTGWHEFVGSAYSLKPEKHYWIVAPSEYATYPLRAAKGSSEVEFEYRPFSYSWDGFYEHDFPGGAPIVEFRHIDTTMMAFQIFGE